MEVHSVADKKAVNLDWNPRFFTVEKIDHGRDSQEVDAAIPS